MKTLFATLTLTLILPNVGLADATNCAFDVSVKFVEGAPVDRFIISNNAKTALNKADIEFDLTPSAGKLIFDTQSGGTGVEVFQPFKSDTATLDVADGAEGLRMPIDGLAAGGSTNFTIDVDDRLTASELGQIRVSSSEMSGALVTVIMGEQSYSAAFDTKNSAKITAECINDA